MKNANHEPGQHGGEERNQAMGPKPKRKKRRMREFDDDDATDELDAMRVEMEAACTVPVVGTMNDQRWKLLLESVSEAKRLHLLWLAARLDAMPPIGTTIRIGSWHMRVRALDLESDRVIMEQCEDR